MYLYSIGIFKMYRCTYVYVFAPCAQARADGSLLGFAFASDESPPSETRYAGLRFQITYVYVAFMIPVQDWGKHDYVRAPPIRVERHLTDILNVNGKTGSETLKSILKQCATKGLFAEDCVCGVGDGGGENEGCAGVHSLMEMSQPSYVRRRCFGHLPWRVTDAGLDSMGDVFVHLNAINVYLRDGTTWNRMKAICVHTRELGGIGLFAETSSQFQMLFKSSPPKIIEDRPECVSEFLTWLLPRQTALALLVSHDLDTRDLRFAQARVARDSLNDRMESLLRRVAQPLVKK
jgi:hypothetical protein